MKPPVIFENEDFIAVNKPAGLLTIPDRYNYEQPSLSKMLEAIAGKIFIVHRLDRDTSGVILFAKNESSHKYFSQLFEKRVVEKTYLGIVKGSFTEKEGIINEPIAEHPHHKGVMIIDKKGKASVTEYKVIEDYGIYSLIRFRIQTGRTHQIRIHAKFAGHPIICDATYGDGKSILLSSFKKKYKLSKDSEQEHPLINRTALHSFQLKLPGMQGEIHLIEAPVPKDMKALLQQLKKNRS